MKLSVWKFESMLNGVVAVVVVIAAAVVAFIEWVMLENMRVVYGGRETL